jgi:hypothetical protein
LRWIVAMACSLLRGDSVHGRGSGVAVALK